MTTTFDAVIVGARCAGAATAMLLARRGARVLVVDHDREGTDTTSTHALMRGGVMQLARWGVLERIEAAGTPPVRRTSFFYGDEAVHVDIPPAHGTEALYAPRRTVLDPALVGAARAAGAEIRFGMGLRRLVRDGRGRVAGVELSSGEKVSAGIVVGADGRRSTVARHVEAQDLHVSANASAVVYAYADGLPDLGYRWYWAEGAGGGIIPTNDGLSCVFVATPSAEAMPGARTWETAGFARLAEERVPRMAADLAGAGFAGRPVFFRGAPGHVRQSAGPGWALVGDAGYFKDPITAHGITDALRDAEILAEAILGGRPESYPAARDALTGDFFRLTDEIASYRWSLDAVKDLHKDLNRAMKPTQGWIAAHLDAPRQAA